MADLNMARLIVVTRIAAGGRDLTTRALTITPEKLRIRRIKKKAHYHEALTIYFLCLPMQSLPA